ncbi:hypothetical protein V4R08_17630 (plasmid) [Nitrobacter sp. NHB1]|uniref:hypothetical protein n=1 Tax=Nitrobacter sp. NHB1 TaxID=3119830 RepID=UPI003000514F
MTAMNTKDECDVLYALALAMPTPDPKTLDDFVRRHPQHAAALTEFAVELALNGQSIGEEEGEEAVDVAVSPAVSRAISHFQNVSFELEQKGLPGNLEKKGLAEAPKSSGNPFASLSTEGFRAYAAKLGANSIFVVKLRDGRIEPESIYSRPGFCKVAADGLDIPVEALMAHVRSGPTVSAQQLHKSDSKPVADKRETFEEAVRSSGMTPEQQQHLLAM